MAWPQFRSRRFCRASNLVRFYASALRNGTRPWNARQRDSGRSSRRARRAGKDQMVRVVLTAALLLVTPELLLNAVPAQDRPLPDPETFYRMVRQNLTRAERSQHLFTYKERRTDVHTNPFGRLGTGGTSVFHVYPSPARRLSYRRLMERDGKPIPQEELAEQDREYRLRVDEVMRERALRAFDRQSLEQESGAARQRQQRAIDDVIDTLQFHLKGRTTHDGVSAIVVTFTPKPNARPTTRQGRTAQKFTGTVWVD